MYSVGVQWRSYSEHSNRPQEEHSMASQLVGDLLMQDKAQLYF
jgi:hypothetical protein